MVNIIYNLLLIFIYGEGWWKKIGEVVRVVIILGLFGGKK